MVGTEASVCKVGGNTVHSVLLRHTSDPAKAFCDLREAQTLIQRFSFLFANYVYVPLWEYVHEHTGVHGGQKRASDHLELKFQMVGDHLVGSGN